MRSFWVKTPWWLKVISPSQLIWEIPVLQDEPAVYITFDDGPHPVATPYAMQQLELFDAQATFFCVGENVKKFPGIYRQLLQAGHKTGNHSFNHLNGWKTDNKSYFSNIEEASQYIDSRLFRPPYGMIKRSQVKILMKQNPAWKICMWDVLSGDFAKFLSPEQCLQNVLQNIKPGSIVIFHDSEKAWERMQYALPRVLEYCTDKNWKLLSLPL